MSERIYYVVCADDCRFEGMTKEQIIAAIAEATGNTPTGVDDAFITKIKEIRANNTNQLWIGTEAQFNALNPVPTVGKSVVRIGADGILYLCTDDSSIPEVQDAHDHITDKNNPHNVTFEQTIGDEAVPIANGGHGGKTAAEARANLGITPANIGAQPAFSILPLEKGGTGSNTAAQARANLEVPHSVNGDVRVNNQNGFSTSDEVYCKWMLWNLEDSTGQHFPAGLVPCSDGRQVLGFANKRIAVVYALEYSGGTWNGNAIAVGKGGTGATDAAGARNNLGITPANIGAVSKSGDNVDGYLVFGQTSNGLRWGTADGTIINLRPYSQGNVFQLTMGNPSNGIAEYGVVNIGTDGVVSLAAPLPLESGGTGGANAEQARANIDAQKSLGFTPIQQGDAAGLNNNKICIGWTNNGTLKVLVDNIDAGEIVTTGGASNAITPVERGGTGTNNVAMARYNLEVPHLMGHDIVGVPNQGGIGTARTGGDYWQFWNWQDDSDPSIYPLAFAPSANNTQQIGLNHFRVKNVWANNYPCGTWNGNAIAVAKGGTGATDAAGARANLGAANNRRIDNGNTASLNVNGTYALSEAMQVGQPYFGTINGAEFCCTTDGTNFNPIVMTNNGTDLNIVIANFTLNAERTQLTVNRLTRYTISGTSVTGATNETIVLSNVRAIN